MRLRLFSDDAARAMYSSGKGNPVARRFSRLWVRVMKLGVLPRRWVVLEVPGRKSGQTRSFPLGMADVAGEWYLVSMLGECAWVRNVRAARGEVALRRLRSYRCRLEEVPAVSRSPILKRYVDKVPGGRPHIPVPKGSSVEDFQKVAAAYPVFRVLSARGLRKPR